MKWKWYTSGAAIIAVSLFMLGYLIFMQLYGAVHSGLDEQALWLAFADNVLKCVVVVLAIALLWYFVAIEDCHTTFSDLMDIFVDEKLQGQSEDIHHPYSKSWELAQLLQSANTVVRTNEIYRSQLDKQKRLLLENYIMRLMKGRAKDIPSTYEAGEALGVDLCAKSLQVVVFYPDKNAGSEVDTNTLEDKNQVFRILIDPILFAAFKGYFTEVDGMITYLLLSVDDLSANDLQIELRRIMLLVQQIILVQTSHTVRIAAGSVSVGIAGIEKSFSEALELLQYAEITDTHACALIYREMPPMHTSDMDDNFWFKKEMQFMNCVSAQDFQNAARIFSEILDSDYLRDGLPLKLANCRMMGLINSMVNTLGKVRLTIDADFFEKLDPWTTILSCRSLSELKKCSNEILGSINHYFESQKKQSPYDRMTPIMIYLKEHYNDCNLCVSSVADHFDLNPSYLSRIFKKIVGMGLAEYLQRIRISAAMQLMKDNELSVKEVAERVGYNNALTMNRAFKKYEGTTAGKLRNMD